MPLLSLFLLVVSGCAAVEYNAGDVPTPSRLEDLQIGVSDRQQILPLLGEPTHISPLDDRTWYYIHRSSQVVAFYKPEELDWQVIALYFDDDGLLADIRLLQNQDGFKVAMNPDHTPMRGRELSFLEQLISSYGKGGGTLPQ